MYKCPCCGKQVLTYSDAYYICEICGWEDDPTQRRNPDETDCANVESLNGYRKSHGIIYDDTEYEECPGEEEFDDDQIFYKDGKWINE